MPVQTRQAKFYLLSQSGYFVLTKEITPLLHNNILLSFALWENFLPSMG